MLRVDALTIDLAARTVDINDNRLELPAKEYELLRALAHEPTRVFTREELLREVWGHRHGGPGPHARQSREAGCGGASPVRAPKGW